MHGKSRKGIELNKGTVELVNSPTAPGFHHPAPPQKIRKVPDTCICFSY
jgi:hypothetical protein